MAACSSRVLQDICVCYDLRYKLMYLNLDRMLSRLPEFEVEKLNHKFIGLILEELEKYEGSEFDEEEPEDQSKNMPPPPKESAQTPSPPGRATQPPQPQPQWPGLQPLATGVPPQQTQPAAPPQQTQPAAPPQQTQPAAPPQQTQPAAPPTPPPPPLQTQAAAPPVNPATQNNPET